MLHHNLLLTYYYSSLPLSKGSKSGVWNQCILMLTSCILASYNEELQQKRRGYFFLQMVSKKHYCTWAAKTQRLKTVSKPFQCLPFFLTACCVWQVGLHAVLPFTNTHALLQYQCIQNCVLALCTFSFLLTYSTFVSHHQCMVDGCVKSCSLQKAMHGMDVL